MVLVTVGLFLRFLRIVLWFISSQRTRLRLAVTFAIFPAIVLGRLSKVGSDALIDLCGCTGDVCGVYYNYSLGV